MNINNKASLILTAKINIYFIHQNIICSYYAHSVKNKLKCHNQCPVMYNKQAIIN